MTQTRADTVPPVTPQHRGIVPDANVDRILAALQGKEDADTELRAAVVAALKAGGSVREVMRVSGLSNDTVQRWGREGGWPTEEQKAAREATRERNAAWRRFTETGETL